MVANEYIYNNIIWLQSIWLLLTLGSRCRTVSLVSNHLKWHDGKIGYNRDCCDIIIFEILCSHHPQGDRPMAKKKAPPKSKPKTGRDSSVETSATDPVQASGSSFPIIGIGASAGGLAAFEAFFSGMPTDTDPGMAFVLVQHLAPDHKSILTDLIQRYTRMKVFEVVDGMVVKPNCTYIIPPNRDMAFIDGALQLLEPSAPRGQRLPIDFFFRSLAQDQGDKAIGIVLSGTGSDGTLGIRAIKGEGGLVLVQTPETTEYDGMPRSAIGTGLVDYELPPTEMPSKLILYVKQMYDNHGLHKPHLIIKPDNSLKKIFILLRGQTSHDFSQYKPSTILRRIERRMAVNHIESMEAYVKFLQQTPSEVAALFRDLLIGVTNFFRDPEAFRILEEQVIPKLFSGKPAGSILRVWTPGCSTGEEAYSLAILFQEHIEALKQSYKVQLFATDIDSNAIATARNGVYPSTIAADISPERLNRFFSTETGGGGLRIQKVLRDMLVFSEQNVIKDPPFSKLDLICCRNLLIYLNGDLQKKLIPLFHYALNPGGYLFLGTSETVGEFGDLFATLDRKQKIYQRKDVFNAQRLPLAQFLPSIAVGDAGAPKSTGKASPVGKLPLRELTEQTLLKQFDPVAALVNDKGVIFYLHGRSGLYLELAPGEVGAVNIFKIAREGLQRELTTALHRVAKTKELVQCAGLRVKTNGDFATVNMTVRPVAIDNGEEVETNLYLVILEHVTPAMEAKHEHMTQDAICPETIDDARSDTHVAALKQELRNKEEYLQTTLEELETSNEELKSSNEEMQSVNEELQSTNEELETSKEELQSVNEELATVNAELQNKVADLSRANNDMNNLLAGMGVATVFVDTQLRILRFTPAATQIINLISSDVGRPVQHIVSNLIGYDSLVVDAQAVLDTLTPKAIDVEAKDGKQYNMRIRPYRTLENMIEGVVISFYDVTELKSAQHLLAVANDQLRYVQLGRDARDAVLIMNSDGNILAWNHAAHKAYGWDESDALTMNIRDLIPEEVRDAETGKFREIALGKSQGPHASVRLDKSGKRIPVEFATTPLVDEKGRIYAIATLERVV
ncbi:putative chemotaxis CheB/CheR fusion protein [Solidesulfovibrio magneticus RS-1]|uniref:Chemotaxis CheB/CheR fusion protein n=1 Tax=Solidesulfovibrio magneticus (strain ATCC 700980 / DSM 13731 / RS-1) TaxID=573370 RepID=C4XQG9_SOLM1|nr:putative chemotaxis CheB/CheR fusion protein [Solidesulfovibrio magneticus RS-1]